MAFVQRSGCKPLYKTSMSLGSHHALIQTRPWHQNGNYHWLRLSSPTVSFLLPHAALTLCPEIFRHALLEKGLMRLTTKALMDAYWQVDATEGFAVMKQLLTYGNSSVECSLSLKRK